MAVVERRRVGELRREGWEVKERARGMRSIVVRRKEGVII